MTVEVNQRSSHALELLAAVRLQNPRLFSTKFYSVSFSHQPKCAVFRRGLGVPSKPEAAQTLSEGCDCMVSVRVTNSEGETGYFARGE